MSSVLLRDQVTRHSFTHRQRTGMLVLGVLIAGLLSLTAVESQDTILKGTCPTPDLQENFDPSEVITLVLLLNIEHACKIFRS